MEEKKDLQEYLTEGVEQIVKDALRATLKDPRESRFMPTLWAANSSVPRRAATMAVARKPTRAAMFSREEL